MWSLRGLIIRGPQLGATFVWHVYDSDRPYPVPWRLVHALRLTVAAITHPLPPNNSPLFVEHFKTRCQPTIEEAIYK